MLNFAKQSEQALLGYLSYLGNRDAVLNYHQIQGLLYAMACSPEPVRPSEWFELIWLSDDPHFDDVAEAKSFFQLLVALYRHTGGLVQRELYRPGADRAGHCSAAALADWCDGFLAGHQYLENLWFIALDDLADAELQDRVESVLDWAVSFVEHSARDWSDEESDEETVAAQLEFQQLLPAYQAVGPRWRQSAHGAGAGRLFDIMQSVGRGEPCPCGSGKPFMQCCLH